jgi:hypothetical protein
MRKLLFGSALLLVVCAGLYVRFHHAKHATEVGYAGNRQVTLYSTTAQVREPVAVVNFGDRLEVLQRFQDQVNVRTTAGVAGWINERDLLSADVWQKAKDLETKAATMPVEARGHTKVLTNLHLDPGRETLRIRQLGKGVPVDFLARQATEVPSKHAANADDESAGEPPLAKKEDWWLVRAHMTDQSTFTGWILGRFVGLDVPSPLPDYASSAGMRIVGWFELNRVTDEKGDPRAQYLLVGNHGPEGQACDFTLLRVYTWGIKKTRYETAFVESNVCGKLPVKVAQTKDARGGAEVTFSFEDLSSAAAKERTYRMQQTVVRRVKEPGETKPRAKAHH